MRDKVVVRRANLEEAEQAQAIVELLDMYCQNEFGNGAPLPEQVRQDLIPGLRSQPHAIVFLAYDGPMPVGLAICFWGFSSFYAKPLINIHDLAVVPSRRGQGIGRLLIEAVEQAARERGACRITLEVRGDNEVAQGLYQRQGIIPDNPPTWFWKKSLT